MIGQILQHVVNLVIALGLVALTLVVAYAPIGLILHFMKGKDDAL